MGMDKKTYAPMRTYTSSRSMAQKLAAQLSELDGNKTTMVEAIDLALYDSLYRVTVTPYDFAAGFPGYDHNPHE